MSNTATVFQNKETGKFEAFFDGEKIATAGKATWLNRSLPAKKRAKELNVTKWEFGAGEAPIPVASAVKSTPAVDPSSIQSPLSQGS